MSLMTFSLTNIYCIKKVSKLILKAVRVKIKFKILNKLLFRNRNRQGCFDQIKEVHK